MSSIRFMSAAMRKAPLLNLSLAGACVRACTRSSQPASISRTITSIIVWTRYGIDVGIAPWVSTLNPLTYLDASFLAPD